MTKKEGDSIGIQKLLHPLKNKQKLMGKTYNTSSKYLFPIHKPKPLPEEEIDCSPDPIDEVNIHDQKNHLANSDWDPINPEFYQQSDDEDNFEDEITQVNLQPMPLRRNHKVDDEFISADDDLTWDSSPEQIQLSTHERPQKVYSPIILSDSPTDEHSHAERTQLSTHERPQKVYSPIILSDSLTDEDSHDDEVFPRLQQEPSTASPKLKRRNAMKKTRPKTPTSEPRITRSMLNPETPSLVIINKVQNLNHVLNPREPIVTEVVDMGPAVQNFKRVLPKSPKRSERNKNKEKVDYSKLHIYGRD